MDCRSCSHESIKRNGDVAIASRHASRLFTGIASGRCRTNEQVTLIILSLDIEHITRSGSWNNDALLGVCSCCTHRGIIPPAFCFVKSALILLVSYDAVAN